MKITQNQFDRASNEFKKHAGEQVSISFSKGSFWVSGTDNAISALKKVYKNAEAAFVQNGMFVLRTSFSGEFETSRV